MALLAWKVTNRSNIQPPFVFRLLRKMMSKEAGCPSISNAQELHGGAGGRERRAGQ